MKLSDLTFINLFSYLQCKINFEKFNVITGYNGAGKTNIVRILELLRSDDGNNQLYRKRLNNNQKFTKTESSSLWINVM